MQQSPALSPLQLLVLLHLLLAPLLSVIRRLELWSLPVCAGGAVLSQGLVVAVEKRVTALSHGEGSVAASLPLCCPTPPPFSPPPPRCLGASLLEPELHVCRGAQFPPWNIRCLYGDIASSQPGDRTTGTGPRWLSSQWLRSIMCCVPGASAIHTMLVTGICWDC